MAQLHEHQGKQLLAAQGITIPRGALAWSANQARVLAHELECAVVVKAQVHSTSRAAQGGIKFALTPHEAATRYTEIAQLIFSNTTPDAVLIEEKQALAREFYLGYFIDDALKRPCLLFCTRGGSGIEERAEAMARFVCSVLHEPPPKELKTFLQQANAPLELLDELASTLVKLYRVAKLCEARSVEINPFAQLADGRLMALDSRLSVDDYAVFRHPDLGIEIARELGHPPTKLERIAWGIERDDFRGTFFFVEIPNSGQWSVVSGQNGSPQPNQPPTPNPQPLLIGFHGAGGGGSMASMDAALRAGLQPADYVDTSGNPPASKVYRAARIILSLPGIRGYFLSGSGVASQEQFGLARAVLKAFREVRPTIPAVLRLGGNGEDIAAELVKKFGADLPAPIEAYQKRHSADFCAARLRELIFNTETQRHRDTEKNGGSPRVSKGALSQTYSFQTKTGSVVFDHAYFAEHSAQYVVDACPQNILSLSDKGLPVLNIPEEEAERGKCTECLACEVATWDNGGGVMVDLPIEF